MTPARRVLVIKLGALGDMILAFPAFARIRGAHPDAHITLLTTPPFAELGAAAPWFDAVDAGGRPARLAGALALIGRTRAAAYDLVYDLQGNDRTNLLFQTLRPFPPLWSGVAFGCALPHLNRRRMALHVLERQAEQLQDAGIWPNAPTAPGAAPGPDVGWLRDGPSALPIGTPEPSGPYAILVPGAAPRRPRKRWPADRYAALARDLLARGLGVLVLGGPDEASLAQQIADAAPGAESLAGRTGLADLVRLGSRAALAVGNDTGPMHLIAAAGAPCVSLFSGDSDPALCAPRGRVSVLRRPDLADLAVATVLEAAVPRMHQAAGVGLDPAINLDQIP